MTLAAASVCTLIAVSALSSASPASAAPRGPAPLQVVGNRVTAGGKAIRLRGVNVPGLEWSNNGEGHILASVREAMDGWHANIIRLPVCEDRWFGKAEGQTDGGAAYRAIVDGAVQTASERKGYLLLDLHWSDADDWGQNIGQHKMPDQHSLVFWKDAAARYKDNPAVLFDLYNEPHDMTWQIWRDGGTVEEDNKGRHLTYQTPGLQKLLEAVRGTGARNLVVAGGLDWAYDLTGLEQGFALNDPSGNGVVYATHIYPWKTLWEEKAGRIADRFPVLLGEFGCEPDPKHEDPATWLPKLFAFIDRHQLDWIAWCFHPAASPRLLKDWTYAPTPYFGVPIQQALAAPVR